ncbi:hypothetical protein ACFSBX_01660 [Halobellus rarus]|uniref:Uncharacterized protein n=1 Tax=Halobellus rarus TaxID=1126237 RepID=A0ABD6CI13_9EURY
MCFDGAVGVAAGGDDDFDVSSLHRIVVVGHANYCWRPLRCEHTLGTAVSEVF